jgi:hypothetical protein
MKNLGVNIYVGGKGKAFTIDKRSLWDDLKFYAFFQTVDDFHNFLKSTSPVWMQVNRNGWQDLSYGITYKKCLEVFQEFKRECDVEEKMEVKKVEPKPEKEKVIPIKAGEQMSLF